ncbi:hypothetical protein [Halomonas saccharevitans]|uniref:Uncharacterized protein n=1 Tax=Halomonas saccharevitans TaxID=416872 RepID=A0A1I6ZPY7_9GAMM|nr:hypothetical protein [Halomonas saccharevitans]SFT64692.1 hypothetical protein SAMN04487956_11268 [Halomonas saccharevitans]
MTYLLVMGGLALSVCFTLGWGLIGMGRWLGRRLRGGGSSSSRQKRRRAPNRPRAAPKTSAKAPPKATNKATNKAKTKASPQGGSPKAPSEPWRLTSWLARRRSSLPLGLLTLLLYGGSRLAEYGMAFRPGDAPGEFHRLVEVLGWIAAGLLTLATVSLLAAWRCRR